ncbi:SET-domain protein [Rhodotorula toruloides ATCC 204091]|uniref:BY PROTMAP: gi/342319096/gb/EGU11047.1/ SET-domain protein [Rhodotorula glutinis ATCC 204091] n=1 Tax=Rhodotorula toruloides TaxID=5286 RepID=A0A0K3CF69_RHOTO|nr:SET-domain protein [Rhodotorula toruloides ATCC 204091]
MSSSPTDEGKFLDWFKEKGGTVHRAVAFKQFEGMGRGCVALEDIEYLRTSSWEPYFSLLPTQFESLMFWSPEEFEELEGSTVLNKVGRDEADEEFEQTVKPFVAKHANVFGNPDNYTAELFHRMGSLARLFFELNTLDMMSTARISAGSQIFNTYADPPNSDLLRRYGHVDEVNEADLVEVGLETVVDLVGQAQGLEEEEREAKAEWLLELGIDDTFSIETNYKIPEEMVSAIKAFLLTPEEYAKAQKKESPPKPKLDAASADWARKILDKRLSEYKTSIEEDEALLKESALPQRKRMAVIVRLGEKRILRGARAKLDEEWPADGGDASAMQKDKKRSRDAGKGEAGSKKQKKAKQ